MKHKMFLLVLFALLQTVKLLSAESDTVWSRNIGNYVNQVKFSPDGEQIYVGAANFKPFVVSTATGETIKEFEQSFVTVTAMDLTGDGRYLAVGGRKANRIQIIETLTGTIFREYLFPDELLFKYDIDVYSISMSHNLKYISVALRGIEKEDHEKNAGFVITWDITTNQITGNFSDNRLQGLKYSGTDNLLAIRYTEADKNNITLINTETGKQETVFCCHSGAIADIDFSPDGSLLASCGWDGFIKIWDVEKKMLVKEINAQGHYMYSINMISNTKVLTGNGEFEDMNLKVWDISIPELIKSVLLTLPNGICFNNENKFTVVADYKSITLLNLGSIVSVDYNISDSNVIYPNPSNGSVQIHFEFKKSGHYDILIFDDLSNQIETIFQGYSEEGVHSINWIPKNLPSGVYFCRIIGENYLQSYKILIQR